MIRTVAIPRLGQLQVSQGCVQYQDPNTGLWVSDPNTPACSDGSGGALPEDTGAAGAVADFAGSSQAAANQTALNQLGVPLFGSSAGALVPSAASLTSSSGLPAPIPGLGLGPNVSTWLIWALVGGVVLLVAMTHEQPSYTSAPRRARQ